MQAESEACQMGKQPEQLAAPSKAVTLALMMDHYISVSERLAKPERMKPGGAEKWPTTEVRRLHCCHAAVPPRTFA
jgi:hypothetical protein